ncbi:DUF397 domain-containing protein [Actinomadura barringtoniae]|uniref:DUF397 domain-containing protein n=1 Tax=Actinomadura barringtoniae TaxID=1427535 RepID=A0A939PH94_9ACTN|nr:DUF397 domain-containing protein [Actinomadura barringtoniae]MBO2452237.1 DUF397 domain-containing protein [Actinomadura barringtoniae]
MRAEQASPSPWIKSRHCGASNTCVEVRRLSGDTIAIRGEHQAGDPPAIVLTQRDWHSLIREIKTGALDSGHHSSG